MMRIRMLIFEAFAPILGFLGWLENSSEMVWAIHVFRKHPLPEPAPVVDPADLLPPAPRYAGGGPRSPVNARATKNVSISDLLPHIDIQQRRVRACLPACPPAHLPGCAVW